MNLSEKVFSASITKHDEAVQKFKKAGFPIIREIVEKLSTCFENRGKVLLIGNGGSAADCQHIAGELVGRFRRNRKPLPAISLASDTSVLTCIANDFDFESAFSRQVMALADKEDLLWAFSTSGSSANILKAVEIARDKNIPVVSFTGTENSPLEKNSDVCLCAGTNETGHAQEIHQMTYHIICKYLDELYA